MLAWLDADPATRGPDPDERLADFGELLKRCIARSDLLVLTPKQRKDIRSLHDHFRNNFVHFTPKGWSIEKAWLPRMVGTAMDAAEVLMRQHNVIVHIDEDQQQRLTDALTTVRSHLHTSATS
jgi:DNA-binding MarR family transcriptional regulator